MCKSKFIVDDKLIEIDNIDVTNGITIEGKNPKCGLNICFCKDLNWLEDNVRFDASKYVYLDQIFYTEKYSYIIELDKLYITKKNSNTYLLEIDIPKIEILIPPFDNKNKTRIKLNDNEIEIHKLYLKLLFTNIKEKLK